MLAAVQTQVADLIAIVILVGVCHQPKLAEQDKNG